MSKAKCTLALLKLGLVEFGLGSSIAVSSTCPFKLGLFMFI